MLCSRRPKLKIFTNNITKMAIKYQIDEQIKAVIRHEQDLEQNRTFAQMSKTNPRWVPQIFAHAAQSIVQLKRQIILQAHYNSIWHRAE